jgi:hypothetical protein
MNKARQPAKSGANLSLWQNTQKSNLTSTQNVETELVFWRERKAIPYHLFSGLFNKSD